MAWLMASPNGFGPTVTVVGVFEHPARVMLLQWEPSITDTVFWFRVGHVDGAGGPVDGHTDRVLADRYVRRSAPGTPNDGMPSSGDVRWLWPRSGSAPACARNPQLGARSSSPWRGRASAVRRARGSSR